MDLYQPLHVVQGHYIHRILNFTASYNYLLRCFEICDDLHAHKETKVYITDCVCVCVCVRARVCVCVCARARVCVVGVKLLAVQNLV